MDDFVTNKTLEKLKYDLVKDNLLSFEDLEKAQELANVQNINIGQVLINCEMINEQVLLKFIEEKLHIPFVNLDDYSLDTNCLKYINFNDVQKYRIVPLFKIESSLTVAMSDPLDLFAIDKIIESTGLNIEPVLSSEKAILNKIEQYYHTDNTVGQITTEDAKREVFDWRDELLNQNLSSENIQTLLRAILKQAVQSEIHEIFFEHASNGLNVNFKYEDVLKNTGIIPQILINPFISRLKVLSNLDPSISEIPQLGKLMFKVDNFHMIASISAFPTIQGERISIKIYKPPKSLHYIGLSEKQISQIRTAVRKPGIILVCGTSLSGKTHLIYSILSELREFDNKNIMTIESIAKYHLKRASQCELNENVGFNLDKAIRFIEFQSPDVIYFEGINSKESIDYFTSLVLKNKILLTEFLADNILDLRNKLGLNELSIFKSFVSLIILIHNQKSIEIFDSKAMNKYL